MEAAGTISHAPSRDRGKVWSTPRRLARRVSRAAALPPATPAPQVAYTPALVGFVAALVIAAAGAAAISLRGGSQDWAAAALGGFTVSAVALYAVTGLADVKAKWSTSALLHLAFAFAAGPIAILSMAVCQSGVVGLRRRSGWIRFAFNSANHFLTDLCAWLTFHALIDRYGAHGWSLFLAGMLAGGTELAVNHGLITVVLWLSDADFRMRPWLRAVRNLSPFSLGFGFAAAGTTLFYRSEGPLGVLAFVVPVALIQASLVAMARGVQAHALERDALAQRALDASEMERVRIAADLHDGVVQELAALSYTCSAQALVPGDLTEREGELTRTLIEAAQVTRLAMRDLRTLLIELAPPGLQEFGLHAALTELLSRLERQGRTVHLDCAQDTHLDERPLRLVYRVVQEALRNITRHAECENVWVAVRHHQRALLVQVRDDGRGFSPEEQFRRQHDGHNGLGLLRQTVRDGGAELEVTSALGEGTTVTMTISTAA